MWREPAIVAAYLITIAHNIPQSCLQFNHLICRFRGKPKRIFVFWMSKCLKRCKIDLKWPDMSTRWSKEFSECIKLVLWSKRIDKGNMRHPAPDVPVVQLANSLDWLPDRIRRDDDYSSFVGFIFHIRKFYQPELIMGREKETNTRISLKLAFNNKNK